MTITDDEGRKSDGNLTETGSFMGNIRFDKLELVQKQYGLEEEIDAAISTHTEIANGSIISYKGRYYRVYKALEFDSHILLAVQKFKYGNN